MSPVLDEGALTPVLRDARSVRPFRSSEDYLLAMKEDLAEWLNVLYPELDVSADYFMEHLETGVALCKHANAVLEAAETLRTERADWLESHPNSTQAHLVAAVAAHGPVNYHVQSARPGTFFARDNVSNFIAWARRALNVREVVLFETDDLILRKNEKHVVLTLLDVARRGARLGVAAPVLVQLEREIDREIAAEQRGRQGSGSGDDDAADDDDDDELLLPAGPQPQLVTNDLKSLHEMVRELVEQCQCPVQFPMIRVSEGKYRVGDSKMLIFVRVLRKHVMVRVGGGWDTLAHYLHKHDPCRCRTAHRSPFNARLMMKAGAGGGIEMAGSSVTYDRSPPRTRRSSASSVSSGGGGCGGPAMGTPGGLVPGHAAARAASRSRSPTPTPTAQRRSTGTAPGLAAPRAARSRSRSRSPAPAHAHAHAPSPATGLAPARPPSRRHSASMADGPNLAAEAPTAQPPPPTLAPAATATTDSGQTNTDSGSEVSDEGYRSLGAVASPPQAPPPPPPPLPTAAITGGVGGTGAAGSPRRLAVPGSPRARRRSSADSRRSASPAPSPVPSPSPARRRFSQQPGAGAGAGGGGGGGGGGAGSLGAPPPGRMARSRSACGTEAGLLDHWDSPRRAAPGRTSLRGDPRASPVPGASPSTGLGLGLGLGLGAGLGAGAGAGAGGGSLGRAAGRRARESLGARGSPQRRSLGAGSGGGGGGSAHSSPARAPRPPAQLQQHQPPASAAAPLQQHSLPASLQGSPTKNFSPLLQQILAADDLGSDESVLQKMRDIIKQYSDVVPPAADPEPLDAPAALPDAGLDFTSAWVHGNGVIRPAAAAAAVAVASPAGPPSSAGRKSSVASTATSASTAPTPRRDSKPEGGATRIPLPVFYSAAADC